ncbi:MAG: iron-containing alcohol dehydrogenase family protein [Fusobacterium sp. JB021]|nr:iron-containing alcohol dehydrogenase family protein [Fusobacterium sp. JB021]MDP0506841.1 iron-containing alcohol dehydrogenase family protein [Fusobacterium sp. JB019]
MIENIFTSNYTVGEMAYNEIPKICNVYGKKVVMIGGKTALEKAGHIIKDSIKNSDMEIIDTLWYGGQASFENAKMLSENEAVKKADMIFSVGGGKALDTCKILTGKINKPVFTFPTIAGTCAAMTSVCAVYHPDGVFRDVYFRHAPAEHTFINTKIIAEAPIKYIWAGIGDTLAKGYEPEFSSRGEKLDFSNTMGVTLSSLCKEPIFKNGTKAIKDCEIKVSSSEVKEVVLSIIAATGTVSNALEMKYNSCAAHSLCYGFTIFPKVEEHHLHGELVSYGVLVQTMMDNNLEELKKLIEFYKSIKLPISYKEFGVTENEIEKVIEKACSTGDIEQACMKIDKEVYRNAINKLEDFIQNIVK